MESIYKITLNEFFEWLNNELDVWDGGFNLENMFEKDFDEIDDNDLKDFNVKQYLIDQGIDIEYENKWELILNKINELR